MADAGFPFERLAGNGWTREYGWNPARIKAEVVAAFLPFRIDGVEPVLRCRFDGFASGIHRGVFALKA